MKKYSLFLEDLGDPYFDKRLTYGTLEELTTYLKQYFKRTASDGLAEDELRGIFYELEDETDPNIYAGIVKFNLDWFVTVGTFVMYDAKGTKIEPKRLFY